MNSNDVNIRNEDSNDIMTHILEIWFNADYVNKRGIKSLVAGLFDFELIEVKANKVLLIANLYQSDKAIDLMMMMAFGPDEVDDYEYQVIEMKDFRQ
ncbi:MAG: hypothetical protein GX769_04235 [Erysipelothrix sp.]|nr:hypothetical protein [Erysipelothrix sp.]